MTTKQRLACGAAILRSIDARRQRTGNRNELLALEQAIVDRELIDLVTGGLCDENVLWEIDCRREVGIGRGNHILAVRQLIVQQSVRNWIDLARAGANRRASSAG